MRKLLLIVSMLIGIAYAQDQTIGKKSNIVRVLGRGAIDTTDFEGLPADTVMIIGRNGVIKRRKIGPSSPDGVDSIQRINCTVYIWQSGNSTPIEFCRYFDSAHLNWDSTYIKFFNSGVFLDSVWLPHTYLKAGPGIVITRIGRDSAMISATGVCNGLISGGAISFIDTTLTITPPVTWAINCVQITKVTPSVFQINKADSGYYRVDVIYGDADGNLTLIEGVQDTVLGVPPGIPDSTVAIAIVTIFGGNVSGTSAAASDAWLTGGNSPINDSTFLGTITPFNVRFKIGNVLRARLTPTIFQFGNLSGAVGTTWSEIGQDFISFRLNGSYIDKITYTNIGLGAALTPFTGGAGTTLTGFKGSFLNTAQITSGFVNSQYEPISIAGTTYPTLGPSINFLNTYSTHPIRLQIYGGAVDDPPIVALPNGEGNLIVGMPYTSDLTNVQLNVGFGSLVKGTMLSRMTAEQRIGLIGRILTGNSVGGSGYTNGSYTGITATGGTGSNAVFNITVSGGVANVTAVTNFGKLYTVRDVLTATGFGAGSGFTFTLTAVTGYPGLIVFDTDSSSYFQRTTTAWQNLYNISGGGGTLTSAARGLNALSGVVRMGGILDSAVVIDENGKAFSIQGASTTVPTFEVINSSATVSGPRGLRAESNAGVAAEIQTASGLGLNILGLSTGRGLTVVTSSGTGISTSTATGDPLQSSKTSAAGNTMQRTLFLNTPAAVAPAAGIGTKIDFALSTNSGGLPTIPVVSNSISSKYTNATSGAETSELEITGIAAGSTSSYLNIKSDVLRIHNLADTLATLADVRAGGSASATIYSANSAIATDRDIDLNAKYLYFNYLGDTWLQLDPLAKSVSLTAHGDGGLGGMFVTTATGNFSINLAVTDGISTPAIYLDAVANNITYGANGIASHTFNSSLFNVHDGSNSALLDINSSTFETVISQADGIGSTQLDLASNTAGTTRFLLSTSDGVNPDLSINGNAITQRLTYTAPYQVFNARDSISHYVSDGIDTVSIVENVANNDIIFRATSSIFLHDVYVGGDLNVAQEIIRYRPGREEFGPGSTATTITLMFPFAFFSVDVYKNGIMLPASEFTESAPSDVILASRLTTDKIIIRYRY